MTPSHLRVLAVATCYAVLLAISLTVFPPSDRASVSAQTIEGLDVFGFEELSLTSTATGFTTTLIDPKGAPAAKAAACTVETNAARQRQDGTNPIASTGTLWPVTTGGPYLVHGTNNVLRFRAISTTGTTKLECAYYR